ncbi:MAG TPA: hypothetical protein ENN06_09860 [Desulfobacteraceae bacterium]|nr:hypothetical protein [Desulfobacteraceae bacterium]
MIEQVRNESDKPVLLLDAGGLLFERPMIPAPLLEARKIQAAGIIKAMGAMQYAAVGIAAQDLAVGLNFLAQQDDAPALPWLSANLESEAVPKGAIQPFILTRVAELSIAVIGLTDDQINTAPLSGPKDFRIRPWPDVLADTLKNVRGKADMIILLSSYPDEVNRRIAEEFEEISLIIQSGASTGAKALRLFGHALITQVSSRGQYLGRMDIDWNPSSRQWGQAAFRRHKEARGRLDRINWRLGRMEKRLDERERKENRDYLQLLAEKEQAAEEISRLERQVRTEQDQSSSYSGNFIALKVSLPEDPGVRKIVLQTRDAVNSVHKKTLEEAKRTGNVPASGPESAMTGWQACRSCHPEQTLFWQQTRHAGAWQTLEKARQQFNQDCLILSCDPADLRPGNGRQGQPAGRPAPGAQGRGL